MDKGEIRDMVFNFLDNHIQGGLRSAFAFDASEYAEFNGDGSNNDEIEELLYEELDEYIINFKKKPHVADRIANCGME